MTTVLTLPGYVTQKGESVGILLPHNSVHYSVAKVTHHATVKVRAQTEEAFGPTRFSIVGFRHPFITHKDHGAYEFDKVEQSKKERKKINSPFLSLTLIQTEKKSFLELNF